MFVEYEVNANIVLGTQRKIEHNLHLFHPILGSKSIMDSLIFLKQKRGIPKAFRWTGRLGRENILEEVLSENKK